jgi:hypothetical protein
MKWAFLELLCAAACQVSMSPNQDDPTRSSEATLDLATDSVEGESSSHPRLSPESAVVTLYVDAEHGDDRRGHGRSPERPLRTIGRALAGIPSLVDAAYTIQLAPGRYREDVKFDRFVMPAGTPRTIFRSIMPSRYFMLVGDPEHPENVVIEASIHCINATGVLLFLRGLTCERGIDAGVFATASSVFLDDLRFNHTGGGIHVENSLGHIGGTIRMTDQIGFGMSIRSNAFMRDTTPWHASVILEIFGAKPAGIFLRDQSTLTLQNVSSHVSITDVGPTADRPNPWALYAENHSHAFGGKFFVARVATGFFAAGHSFINVDVEADEVNLLAWAIKSSTVGLERPGSLTAVTTKVAAQTMSVAAVGDVVVSSILDPVSAR